MPDPKTGRYTAISSAFRFTARPAFVVDPPAPIGVDAPPYPGGERTVIERQRFLHAIATRVIAPEYRSPRRGAAQQTVASDEPAGEAPSQNN